MYNYLPSITKPYASNDIICFGTRNDYGMDQKLNFTLFHISQFVLFKSFRSQKKNLNKFIYYAY